MAHLLWKLVLYLCLMLGHRIWILHNFVYILTNYLVSFNVIFSLLIFQFMNFCFKSCSSSTFQGVFSYFTLLWLPLPNRDHEKVRTSSYFVFKYFMFYLIYTMIKEMLQINYYFNFNSFFLFHGHLMWCTKTSSLSVLICISSQSSCEF